MIPNIQNYTSDASVDPSLGKGNNWFTTSNSSITFKGLASGETYRIIAIPKAAIQTETNSNVTPLHVLDTDAWVDTTIGIPKDQGQVLAGAYKSGTEMKGRVMLRQANPNNYYALLAVDSKGRPITGTPVKAWAAPDANGELEFDELDLLANDNKYVVITKPQAFFSFDYAQATYSPTEVYRSGDVIPSGFALNEPVMTATTVTITNKLDYQALSVSELTRTPGQAGNDTLTIVNYTVASNYTVVIPATLTVSAPAVDTTFVGDDNNVFINSNSTIEADKKITVTLPTQDFEAVLGATLKIKFNVRTGAKIGDAARDVKITTESLTTALTLLEQRSADIASVSTEDAVDATTGTARLSARVEANITANQAAKANVAGTHTGPITFAVGLNDIV